jgi:hypothetical protein
MGKTASKVRDLDAIARLSGQGQRDDLVRIRGGDAVESSDDVTSAQASRGGGTTGGNGGDEEPFG